MAWTNWAGWEPGNTDSYGAAEENVMGCFANGIWVDLADHLLWTQHYLIEWEADCNNDGIVDFGQIRNGELADIDGNNIPDCCESGSSCAPNIIVNGGFEVGASQADCTWVIHAAAGSFVPGWSVVAASIDRVRITGSCPPGTESWTSFEGEFTIDLDGDTSGGAISQTVSTEPDSMYRLTFQLTGNCAPGVKPMRVEIGSVQYPFEHVCAGTNPQRWREVSVEFTASASTTSIGFRSLSTGGNNGAVIDAVRLVRVGPQQPTCVDADLYRDFNVNGADLGIMLSQWGPNTPLTESDLNNDGVVNGADLGLLLAFWGACP
jgi:choice-of-anchor C domain-containing protein